MTWKAHIYSAFGPSFLAFCLPTALGYQIPALYRGLFSLSLMFGAILPDIDLRSPLLTHRTITHCWYLWTALCVATPFMEITNPSILMAITGLSVGCLLHILGDMLTYAGVPLGLNPFGKTFSFNLFASGSPKELPVVIFSLGLSFLAFYIINPGQMPTLQQLLDVQTM